MEGDHCAELQWARTHFGSAELGDARRTKRLVELAAAIRADPQASLPQQYGGRAASKAAYRLLSNGQVDPQAMQQPHREQVARQCAGVKPVLVIQDTTELDFSLRAARGSIRGVGPLGAGDGGGQGLLQHAALAVSPTGGLEGVVYQELHPQRRTPKHETRAQRRARGTEAEVWEQCARTVAKLPFGQTPLIHVGDRHADVFSFFRTLRELGHGFIVRAKHDRDTQDDPPSEAARIQRLKARLAEQPVAGHRTLEVTRRAGSPTKKREPRQATVALRYTTTHLPPPRGDARWTHEAPIACQVVEVREQDPSAGVEPIHWMLLTSEPVQSEADARRIVDWYACRWVIEQWHRVLKEGCRLEKSQRDEAMDIHRLAMILGPVAVTLLQMRDLADDPERPTTRRRCKSASARSTSRWRR